ncbi:Bug family tripartite tricarboxylate transporter substrate binding protein [Falsiroseomonas oryziterrae]|uniref:Bug family tripartite tricarboxylate transporter substrate binding protein n=1 Tax=Falsiroseomonas oryziterrae TaxID=2911368 RepID=UPI001F201C8D|nr:tripartite tricarboxylate transporter substrate binding protein [Roseomonas sp. NPKOSM-4]
MNAPSSSRPALSRRSLLGLLGAALPLPALAQPAAFPDRAVRVIIPVAPGGSLDILGRTFARAISPALGQPVVAENHPGAGSNLAFELVARARPDGHTLLVGSDPLTINPSLYRRVGYDPVRDFAPVAELVRAPQVLVVHPSNPATDLASFLAAARAANGATTMGSQGNGSIGHLAGAVLTQRTGIGFTHVPYRGGGPAVVDVVAGHLDALLVTLPAAIEHIRGGRLKALGVTSLGRNPALPEVPAFHEAGLPGFEVVTWQGILAPAGTPEPVVARLNAVLLDALRRPEVAESLAAQGFELRGGTPAAFAELIRTESARWPGIVRVAGATLD